MEGGECGVVSEGCGIFMNGKVNGSTCASVGMVRERLLYP